MVYSRYKKSKQYRSVRETPVIVPVRPTQPPSEPKMEDYGISELDINKCEKLDSYFFAGFILFLPAALGLIIVFSGYFFTGIIIGLLASVGGLVLCSILLDSKKYLPSICENVSQYESDRYFYTEKNLEYQKRLGEYQELTKKRAAQQKRLQQKMKEDYWRNMDGLAFEHEVAKLYSAIGFKAILTPGSGDGGVDIILTKAGARTVAQCKAHAKPVGVKAARELRASIIDFEADSGLLITLNGITKPAQEYISDKPISVIDVKDLVRMAGITS